MWVFGKLQTTGGAQSFSSRKKPTPVRIRIIPNLDIIMLVVGIPKLEQYQSFKMFFSGCFTRPTPSSGEESSSSRRRMCAKKCFGKKVGALFVKELVEADVFFSVASMCFSWNWCESTSLKPKTRKESITKTKHHFSRGFCCYSSRECV